VKRQVRQPSARVERIALLRVGPALSEPWTTLLHGTYLYLTTLLCWPWPHLLFVLLALGNTALLISQPTAHALLLWLFANVFGVLGEYQMVLVGLWRYAGTEWGTLPSWIVWIWGAVMLIAVRGSSWIATRLRLLLVGQPAIRLTLTRLALVLALGYWLAVILSVSPLYALAYTTLGGLIVMRWHQSDDLLLFWVAATLGFLGEASGISVGVWTYSSPYFSRWGIPISVSLAWGLSAVALHRLSEWWAKPHPPSSRQALAPVSALKRETLFLLIISISMYGCLLWLWRTGALITALLVLGWLALLIDSPSPRNLLLSGLGLMLGLNFEFLAVYRFQLWGYARPDVGLLASWIVPGIHGAMPVLLIRATECLQGWSCSWHPLQQRELRRLLWWVGYLSCLVYWIVVMTQVAVPIAIVSFLIGAAVFLYPCSGRDVLLFWLAGITGLLMEWGGIRSGIWAYARPYFSSLGIPISLSLVWGLGSLLLCRFAETLLRSWRRVGHDERAGT